MIPFRGYQMAAGKKAYKKARFRKRNQRVLHNFLNSLHIVNWEAYYKNGKLKLSSLYGRTVNDNGQDL